MHVIGSWLVGAVQIEGVMSLMSVKWSLEQASLFGIS